MEHGWDRAIVTGAAGFIGRHMVRFLRNQGIETLGVDRAATSVHTLAAHTSAYTSARGVPVDAPPVDAVVDLAVQGALAPYLERGTAIFHLAGSANVGASVRTPIPDFRENVFPTLHVLEAARQGACPVLFSSSGSVYDAEAKLPFRERSPIRPSSPYGAAKAAGEAYCFAYYRSYGVDARVARLFSVFGPGMGHFAIRDFCERLQDRPDTLTIRGDGGQTRDYLYVEDAVRALYRVLRGGEPGGVYNVAEGRGRTILSVAEAVATAMGPPVATVRADGKRCTSALYRMEADTDKLTDLGFRPLVSFEEGIARTVSRLREQHSR
uniref:dTDP-glucose 4,6-dehydratase/UDP-glucose 4-epimerase n=1 Tax=Candidatus Kentrum sp. FM TaxID=2126340 RepID=A0A450ST56_9GAMM|nr:MAG: dTDP-glucose 4,6-dehydratase/UDP-glucose 4-epimerase [Candidatus Kentron sp. FM]VFJ57180.1 MAG: dTDP-glucose 4,6-dehydratase/UDP-glucose 4-epimerase [Candidatus Kentron sp. FM]VFK17583.1 MAG: dTDP-glucose 4,6-dehydratase/UDP-glucose 4-epimerase [Candidatus Kentron sp. FM]